MYGFVCLCVQDNSSSSKPDLGVFQSWKKKKRIMYLNKWVWLGSTMYQNYDNEDGLIITREFESHFFTSSLPRMYLSLKSMFFLPELRNIKKSRSVPSRNVNSGKGSAGALTLRLWRHLMATRPTHQRCMRVNIVTTRSITQRCSTFTRWFTAIISTNR